MQQSGLSSQAGARRQCDVPSEYSTSFHPCRTTSGLGNPKRNSATLQSRHAAIFHHPQLGYAEQCAVAAGSVSSTGKSDLGCATVSSSASVTCATATTACTTPEAVLVADVDQHCRPARGVALPSRAALASGNSFGLPRTLLQLLLPRGPTQRTAQQQQAPGRPAAVAPVWQFWVIKTGWRQ